MPMKGSRTQPILGSITPPFTVLEVLGNKVRVGIDAPDNISIVRGELIRNTAPEELSIEDKPIAIHMTVTHHHN